MNTAYITHPDCLKHEMGTGHPESPQRLAAIEDQLIASGLLHYLKHHDAPLATTDQLVRVHSPEYIELLRQKNPAEGLVYLDPDTAMNPHTFEAALRAAGAAVLATDLVMQKQASNAFCAVRPPGHHASANQASGFCFFNNVAVGVAHAIAKYDLQRVAIVDFDVHHGDGTETIFGKHPRVLFCSSFQHPFYPYTGADSPYENVVAVPLSAGADGSVFREVLTASWLPALEAFEPEIIYISAGFDAHLEEDMADLRLVESDYAWITEQIMKIAGKYADKRIVSVLEGGYALHALGRSVTAHLKVLCGL